MTAMPQPADFAALATAVHFACEGLRQTACGLAIRDTDLRYGARTRSGERIRIAFLIENATCPQCRAAREAAP